MVVHLTSCTDVGFRFIPLWQFSILQISLAQQEGEFRVLDIKYRYPRVVLPTDKSEKVLVHCIYWIFLQPFLGSNLFKSNRQTFM